MHLFIDLDGTLTDPKPGFVASIRYALAQLGAAVPASDCLDRYIGPPLELTLQQLLRTTDEHLIEAGISYYRERYMDEGMYENSVYEGIPGVLKVLQRHAVSLLLVTSKPTAIATKILQHFDLAQYFDSVYGSELDQRNGEKSELIANVLATENINNNDAIMIGDRKYDVAGARINSMRSIGVLWGYGSEAELTEAGASGLCGQPAELPAGIDLLLQR